MQRRHRRLTNKHTWLLSSIFMLTAMGNVGCSLAGDQILPTHLENRLASPNATAEDYLTAAHLYQLEAQRLAAEGAAYTRKAASISPLEDSKGFRRDALKTTGQHRQKQAQDLLQLIGDYERKAEALTAQHP